MDPCDTSEVNINNDIQKIIDMIVIINKSICKIKKENKLQNKKLRALCRRIERLEETHYGHAMESCISESDGYNSTSCTSSSCSSSHKTSKLEEKLDNLYKITFNK